MEIYYRRNLNQSYMIVTSESSYSGYQIHMCRRNRIPGLLSFEVLEEAGRMQFCYEITGKRSLDHMLESSDFTLPLFIRILETLVELCRNIKAYLLEEEGILLEPESIYMTNDGKQIAFAYCPGRTAGITESFRHLMEYLLTKIDHADEQMVLAGYEAYQKSAEEGFALEEILKILYQYRQQNTKDFVSVRTLPQMRQEELNDSCYEGEEEEKEEKKPSKGTIKRFLEHFKAERNGKDMNDKEERYKKCIGVVLRVPDFLKNRINREKEPCVYMPEDYAEQMRETPTVYLGEGNELEGILRYAGTGEVEDIRLNHFPFILGSGDKSDGMVVRQGVSRMHARITREQENYYIEDLNSMNGTWLNEELLVYHQKEKLNLHDTIRLGREEFTFV